MPLMPEPESEFRDELEFRKRVYSFLAMGLSTTEIERIMDSRIDWRFFSRDRVEELQKESHVVTARLEIPQEFQESLAKSSLYITTALKLLEARFVAFTSKNSNIIETLNSVLNRIDNQEKTSNYIGKQLRLIKIAIYVLIAVTTILLFK